MSDWMSREPGFGSSPGAPIVLQSSGIVLPSASVSGDDRDALRATITLGHRAVRGGFLVWALFALLTHGVVFGWARGVLYLREFIGVFKEMRDAQRAHFGAQYEIDVARDEVKKEEPPPEPEPPPPDPAPAPMPQPRALNAPPPKDDPYDTPPPAPAVAQAAKVLTTDEPVDLTGQGFVSGEGSVGYGQIAAAGTGTVATRNPNAVIGGVVGGTGTGTGAPPLSAPGPDLSKPPGLVGGTAWNCGFPPEADVDQIDEAVALIVVTVRPDGSPLSVKVVTDPGHGFGRSARRCALGRRFTPGLNREGVPTTSTTAPIRVRFTR